MSDSERGKRSADLAKYGGAVIALLISWLVVWELSAQISESRTHQESANYTKQAQQEIDRTCVGIDATQVPQCVSQILQTTRDAERADHDLQAQRDMANWARLMFLLSAGGLPLTVVGIYFVRENLLEMQRQRAVSQNAVDVALKSMARNTEIAHTQSRAAPSPKSATTFTSPLGIFLTVTLQNNGQTSVNGGLITPIIQITYTDGSTFTGYSNPCQIGAIAPNRTEEFRFHFTESELTGNWFGELLDGRANLGATLKIEWYDVFGGALEFHVAFRTNIAEIGTLRRRGGIENTRNLVIDVQTASKVIKKSDG